MSVVAIGLNHRSVPLELFERLTLAESAIPKALTDIGSRSHVSEAVVLSTCNRTEFYVFAERFHGAFADVRNSLSLLADVPADDFSDDLYAHYGADAVAHLFAVTSGLDSAIVGENEIQGQVRRAWEVARVEGTCGTTLNTLFRHALEVGKRSRTETSITRDITSVAQAAVAMTAQHLGDLSRRRILVLGAGEMGKGMASALAGSGAAEVVVANRTLSRAVELAERIGGRAIPLGALLDELTTVDVLLTSTGASSLMVERAELAQVMTARQERELLVVDIAVPRDIDPASGAVVGVILLDMADLALFAQAGRKERHAEIDKVRDIIEAEVDRYIDATTARSVAPLIAAFRDKAETIRAGELERFAGKFGSLDMTELDAVEALTRGILGKLLHEPTVRLKDAAGTARGARLAEAMRDLYEL